MAREGFAHEFAVGLAVEVGRLLVVLGEFGQVLRGLNSAALKASCKVRTTPGDMQCGPASPYGDVATIGKPARLAAAVMP